MHPPLALIKRQEEFGKALLGKKNPAFLKGLDLYVSIYLGNLEGVLRKLFPSLYALLGDEKFSQKIALPFIQNQPPSDWQLSNYGLGMSSWLKKQKLGFLSPLLFPLSEVDELFLKISLPVEQKGFIRGEVEVIDSFYPLMSIRKALLKREPLPSLEKKEHHFVLSCDQEGTLMGIEVDAIEAKLLRLLKQKMLDEALLTLVQDKTVPIDSLETLLPDWSSKWAKFQWIDSATIPSLLVCQ